MRFKDYLEEQYSVRNKCKNFRRDDETCTTGCKKSVVIKGNLCPWSDDNEEAKEECACYK